MTKTHAQTIKLEEEYDQEGQFKDDVLNGLSKKNKTIPSKYFYDQKGSDLFNKITLHKDYYLTASELEIINYNKSFLSSLFSSAPFNLIELGPGEGIKTLILLQEFSANGLNFTYLPIDISNDYLKYLNDVLPQKIEGLDVCGINADFFKGLRWLGETSDRRNVVLFLGSSIGNLDLAATRQFLRTLWTTLNHNDYVLIGFDLRKDINVLMKAYDDEDGLTREFNLNLLARINEELGANFNIQFFKHYPVYNPKICAMESYLISTISQIVRIKALDKVFYFDEYEGIHLEYSHKYTLRQIDNFALNAGFKLVSNFVDSKRYFVDALWQVQKLNGP